MASASTSFTDEEDDELRREHSQRLQNLQRDSDYSQEEEAPTDDDFDDYAELESLQLHRQRRSGIAAKVVGEGRSSRPTPARKSSAQVIDEYSEFEILFHRSGSTTQ